MNGRTFNRAEIKAWQDELTRIPHQIAELVKGIKDHEDASQGVLGRLEAVRVIIRPMDANIKALTSRISILNNQEEIARLQKVITNQQAIVDANSPNVPDATKALTAANEAVNHTKQLQNIKAAQQVMNTHPQQITQLQVNLTNLNSLWTAENNASSNLSSRISTLRSEISNLEERERQDRYRHMDHHHHHHHHHGHHDHQPSVFNIIGGFAHAVGDIGASMSLSSKRGELSQKENEQRQHANSASSYSRQIDTANRELSNLQSVLASNQGWLVNIPYDQQTLASNSNSYKLDSDLSARETELRRCDAALTKLQDTIKASRWEIRFSEKNISDLTSSNASLTKVTAKHSTNDNEADLNQQLVTQRESKKPHAELESQLLQQNQTHIDTILQNRNTIYARKARQALLAGNAFLTQLRDRPEQLLQELVTGYEAAVKKFNTDHPANQSEVEQTVMFEMRRDVPFIQQNRSNEESQVEGQVEGLSTVEYKREDDGLPHNPERAKVYQLCGLLKTKMATIAAEEKSSALVKELQTVTNKCPLDDAEAQAAYQQLHRPLMTSEDMADEALGIYDLAAAALRTQVETTRKDVKELKALAESAAAYADSVDANKAYANFDVAFYTKVLVAAKELLERPSSQARRDKFNALVVHDTLGNANNCKRGTGVLSMFLGAALVAGTVVAEKLGYLEDVVPNEAKYAGYGVGGAAFLGGALTLWKGRPKGSVKQAQDFASKATKVKFFAQPSQQPAAAVSGQDFKAPLLSVVADTSNQPSAPNLSPSLSRTSTS